MGESKVIHLGVYVEEDETLYDEIYIQDCNGVVLASQLLGHYSQDYNYKLIANSIKTRLKSDPFYHYRDSFWCWELEHSVEIHPGRITDDSSNRSQPVVNKNILKNIAEAICKGFDGQLEARVNDSCLQLPPRKK